MFFLSRIFLVAALGLSLPAAAAEAPPAAVPVIAMQHASWSAADGAPTGVTGIAQTPDGWLWIGSSTGLYRFDGVRFQRAPAALAPMSSNIAQLGVLRDGTLWIAYKFGGASLMRGGTMRHFRAGERNTPGGTAGAIGQDEQGRIWYGGHGGLRLLGADDVWRDAPAALGAPAGEVADMHLDRRGRFWVRTRAGVFVLAREGSRFEQKVAVAGFGALAEHPDGSIWTSDMQRPGLSLVEGGPGADPQAWRTPDRINRFEFDRRGALWFPNSAGVERFQHSGTPGKQEMGADQGLSGNHGFVVFEDREGDVWVGTENGLDRFRDHRLSALALPRYIGGARPLAAHPGGGVWIDRVFVASPGAAPEPFAPAADETDLPVALHAAPDGTLWIGGTGGLRSYRDGRRLDVALPPELDAPGMRTVFSMATGADGALWVGFGRRGLYTLRGGAWSAHGGVPGLAGLRPTVLAGGPQGALWFGSTDDQLAVLAQGRLRRVGREQGLRIGTVMAILPAADGAWIGGENGVAWFDGSRVVPLLGRGGDPFAGTSGMVFADDGTLWLNGGAGISALAPAELRKALADPAYRVQFERLDYRDGLRGTASGITPMPSAVKSRDGALWFSTTGATVGFDPAALPRNRLVPPVHITALSAGGKEYALGDAIRVSPHAGPLAIAFTALSYRAPERMRFRYRLEGVDQDWQESERHRFAHYTNLAPGRYRFRVLASNDDGVWNENGASLSFEVLPSLTQTAWFRAGAMLALLAGLWLLHRMRMRRLARRMQMQMQARLSERERIARELHDTLLQSVQGLLMKLGAAVHRLRAHERAPLEEALVDARRVLGEGRDRVAGLRGETVAQAGLAGALEEYGTALAQGGAVAFSVRTLGRAAPLDTAACEAVFAIAREAIWNAFVHAQARSVSATLDYGNTAFSLRVEDDGIGIAPEVLAAGARPGHWGMPGMRERAAGVGELSLDSAPGRGTAWTLRLPLGVRGEAPAALAGSA